MLNSLEEFEKQEKVYNEICQAVMVKICTKTNGINDKVIPVMGFDKKNSEHLFFMAVARGLSGVLGVQIAPDISSWQRNVLNKKIKVEGSKFVPFEREYVEHAAVVDDILEEVRPWAAELCEMDIDDFDFGDIYYEFYA
jgi:hypothetical protein